MTAKSARKIIKIDEDKCDGCGLCASACAERALQIVNGKAKLVSEKYCDGLAACMGECPQGALTIEERKADAFDEEAVKSHLLENQPAEQKLPCGCPSASVAQFGRRETQIQEPCHQESMLSHWPVQLTLIQPGAPFLNQADVMLVADCVPFAYAGFHQEFLKNHAVLVACPKLDDFEAHLEKLTAILEKSAIKSLTVVHMEVPCCSGLVRMAKQALMMSHSDIPFKDITIGIRGDLLS